MSKFIWQKNIEISKNSLILVVRSAIFVYNMNIQIVYAARTQFEKSPHAEIIVKGPSNRGKIERKKGYDI